MDVVGLDNDAMDIVDEHKYNRMVRIVASLARFY